MADAPEGRDGVTYRLIDMETAEERPMKRKGGRSLRIVDDTIGARTVDLHMNILPPTTEEESPYHIHEHAENVYFVLEGQLSLRLGKDLVDVKAGQAVFIPPMLPHAVWNSGEGPARLLEMYSPPGPDFVVVDGDGNPV